MAACRNAIPPHQRDGDLIRIRTGGRRRVLHISHPRAIVRPEYRVNGQDWTDYPASGWGTYDRTWLIGLSVPDGTNELEVREMRFPSVWSRAFVPLIEGVLRDAEAVGAAAAFSGRLSGGQ